MPCTECVEFQSERLSPRGAGLFQFLMVAVHVKAQFTQCHKWDFSMFLMKHGSSLNFDTGDLNWNKILIFHWYWL